MDTINKIKPVILTLFILIAVSGVINAELNFIDPTPPNGSEIYTNHTTINVLINTTDLSSMIWNWNGTNTTFMNDSCVLHLSFDNNSEIGDSSTVVRDVSQYENNGSFTNGSTGNWTTDGKWNGAISFDGVNDCVNCGNDPILNPETGDISFGMWVNTVATSGYFLSKAEGENRYFMNVAVDGSIRFQLKDGGSSVLVQTDDAYNDGIWYHVFVTIDKDVIDGAKIYIDSNLKKSGNPTGVGNVNPSTNLHIGSWSGGGVHLNGSIDEVRIYNRALSPEEVRQSYLSNLHKFNASRWYFKTKQTDLPLGEHNYQAFANNVGSEYRILIISILRPTTLLEELNLICYEISGEISDINMSNYLVYAFILMGILLIILGIQIITNNIKR